MAKYDELERHGKLGSLQYRTDIRFIRQRRKEYDAAEEILKPTLKTSYEYLKNDRYLLWNIADIKVNNSHYPLQKDSINYLKELGCEYKGIIKMLMTRMLGMNPSDSGILNTVKIKDIWYKYEPIIVMYKK